MADFDLVLSGTVVLPKEVIDHGFVAVRDGLVAMVGRGAAPAGRERHDLGQALILPGAIDAQVHSLSQKGQEDFIWSTRSAAAGGVTAIVDMPYDEGDLVCSAEAVARKTAHASGQARVDFALYGTVDPLEGPARIQEMVDAGVASFKFSTFGTDAKRFPRIPPAMLHDCFEAIAPTGDPGDIWKIDELMLARLKGDPSVTSWIRLARAHVPFEGLPARIAWLGHGMRMELALAVNDLVRQGELAGPIAFSRDHLDAGAMAHPNIMTEGMKDGSDAIADWPLLDAMALCASMADLVAIHSGGGYSGFMTSAGVTLIADGTEAADLRLSLALTNDTSIGVMRYADAGYAEAMDEAAAKGIDWFD